MIDFIALFKQKKVLVLLMFFVFLLLPLSTFLIYTFFNVFYSLFQSNLLFFF